MINAMWKRNYYFEKAAYSVYCVPFAGGEFSVVSCIFSIIVLLAIIFTWNKTDVLTAMADMFMVFI